ncbi:Nucleoside-diphosphate-sugar epimerase [Pedobacter westerhofensis]|uniref:Nucleoside-diphosphate-sugar epimerase n=1 Tax=Pedobacter westerhofensis TaxID=425512 RepID=A0A521FCC9_9SPHI|nr:SDR family oxidoreductase [Pedobacter westerhofensis]SMO93170.1 Nucleoside-diphosphate-sugar epimerase [Pedobacter westerhofensis]
MYILDKKISILGCGWYGLALAKKLMEAGYTVKGSTTTPNKQELLKDLGVIPYIVSFQEDEETFDPGFFESSILMICIPPKRSTAEQHTFLSKITKIANAASHGQVQNIVFISSTSVYGDLNTEVDEHSTPFPDTDSGKAMLAAESLLKSYPDFTTTVIRFGGLIGPDKNPGRFFAGKSDIPNGQAPVNLIHLSDCLGITLKILEDAAFGDTYNACSPQHPLRSVFYTNAAIQSNLAPPQFKNELLNWKKVNSVKVSDKLNYNFEVKLIVL